MNFQQLLHQNNLALHLALLLTFASSSPATTTFRGLDRLYFTQLSVKQLDELRKITKTLGPRLHAGANGECITNDNADYYLCHDFELKRQIRGHRIVIRKLIETGSRVHRLWWIVYDNGIQCDAWQYSFMPDGESKILTNYEISSITENSVKSLKIRIDGSMFQNGGSWIEKGIELKFARTEGAIRLQSVLNSFTFSNIDNHNGGPSAIGVSTEQYFENKIQKSPSISQDKNFERLAVSRIRLEMNTGHSNWARMQRVANCLTNDSTAPTTFRRPTTPSLIEKSN
ncbi:MAG: hypothetical protein IPK50_07700 [Fibrobacterota bacterium]|nr:MAG: hypothetical protein IPK50_07700 [Fibrobacterota bacterium]